MDTNPNPAISLNVDDGRRIRVLRIIEYVYASPQAYVNDRSRWTMRHGVAANLRPANPNDMAFQSAEVSVRYDDDLAEIHPDTYREAMAAKVKALEGELAFSQSLLAERGLFTDR